MKLKILEIEMPKVDSVNWMIRAVDRDNGNTHRFPVFDPDLRMWFREATGRNLGAGSDAKRELHENLTTIEPKLTTEITRMTKAVIRETR